MITASLFAVDRNVSSSTDHLRVAAGSTQRVEWSHDLDDDIEEEEEHAVLHVCT